MAGFDSLSARGEVARAMKGSRGGEAEAPPPMPEETEVEGQASDENAIQSALDGIDQAADTYGPDVAVEIRSHVNAIRELVSQGEAGAGSEEAPPGAEGMASPTPDTQMPIETAEGMTP